MGARKSERLAALLCHGEALKDVYFTISQKIGVANSRISYLQSEEEFSRLTNDRLKTNSKPQKEIVKKAIVKIYFGRSIRRQMNYYFKIKLDRVWRK